MFTHCWYLRNPLRLSDERVNNSCEVGVLRLVERDDHDGHGEVQGALQLLRQRFLALLPHSVVRAVTVDVVTGLGHHCVAPLYGNITQFMNVQLLGSAKEKMTYNF